jgi:WD40 repeat protein
MLPASQPHPSPPNVLAISSDGNILLSASPSPPTILLQDQRWAGGASVSLCPVDTPSATTCAAFQGPRKSVEPSYTQFVLGFQDGTLVLYKVHLPFLAQSHSSTRVDQHRPFQLQPVRVEAIRKLHKTAMGGIKAAAFIPGYSSRVVSVGHDGRCRLVDFEGGGKKLRT